jgi:lipoprotein signal peptidase
VSNVVKRTSSFLFFWIIHEISGRFFTVVVNPGISFGIELPFILIILINLILVVLYLNRKDWGLFLISTGGLINLADRIRFGYIRDYWHLGMGIYNNLNDWLIIIGLIIFSLELIWKKSK